MLLDRGVDPSEVPTFAKQPQPPFFYFFQNNWKCLTKKFPILLNKLQSVYDVVTEDNQLKF